jgi:hypothetical protein
MSRAIRARLARLEAGLGTKDIAVWCDTPEEMEETIAAMNAEGEIQPDQRVLCVHWEWARCGAGEHERHLDEIST